MSRVPLGKVLLRNVIRHTDAHNKIQEESEMWKIRELEKQTKEMYAAKSSATSPDGARWDHSGYKELYPEEFETKKQIRTRMRCDGFEGEVPRHFKSRSVIECPVTTEQEVRQARKRFHECETTMPDRWGHSGYKELYPEEFDTDSEVIQRGEKKTVNGKKTSRLGRRAEQESRKRKRSKKSHKKKQKKHSHKKAKKRKKEEHTESSSESDNSEEITVKVKHKKKTRKKLTRKPPSSSGLESDSSESSSFIEISSDESEKEDKNRKRTKRRKKKRHSSKLNKDFETQEKKSKRKNWKVANDERSDSSDED